MTKAHPPEYRAGRLGRLMASLYEAVATGPDKRCETCAFRPGTPANCQPNALFSTLKCDTEREPFGCHEEPHACYGWKALFHGDSPEWERLKAAFLTEEKRRADWFDRRLCVLCGGAPVGNGPFCGPHAAAVAEVLGRAPEKVRQLVLADIQGLGLAEDVLARFKSGSIAAI